MLQRLIKICGLFLLCLVLYSCDKRQPTQASTDFSILQFSDEKIPLPGSNEYLFRQTATVQTDAKDDVLIAWRITTTDSILPAGVVTDSEGWIYHYQTGADPS
ncbi:MAG: hypothetical protein R6V77_08125, partial [Candidatus Cloacimonadaceae bacterium]